MNWSDLHAFQDLHDCHRFSRLVHRHYEHAGGGSDSYSQDGATWLAIRDALPNLDMAVAGGAVGVNLSAGPQTAYVQQQRVSTGFFRVLGIAPARGRESTNEEDQPTGPSVVVISHALWTRTLAADPNILGKPITLRGEPFVVVGVMPAGFHASVPADVWTPLRPSTSGEGAGANYALITRLRPGVAWTEVERQLEAVGGVIVRERFRRPASVRLTLYVVPWQQAVTASVRQPLLVLWRAVLMVLLIGCVNIAGLLVALSSARAREIAMRIALGGGRGAIFRQILVESVVLGRSARGTDCLWRLMSMPAPAYLRRAADRFHEPVRLRTERISFEGDATHSTGTGSSFIRHWKPAIPLCARHRSGKQPN